MQKVIVIGCPGSGKSTFSRALHAITGIPLFHLDMLFWNADKTTVEKCVFRQRLLDVMAQDAWILDGNYSSTMELRLQECDTVIFLDYPLEVCLEGVRARKGQVRSDLPWVETEENPEFMEYIRNFPAEHIPTIRELLRKYAHKHIIICKSRADANAFLSRL